MTSKLNFANMRKAMHSRHLLCFSTIKQYIWDKHWKSTLTLFISQLHRLQKSCGNTHTECVVCRTFFFILREIFNSTVMGMLTSLRSFKWLCINYNFIVTKFKRYFNTDIQNNNVIIVSNHQWQHWAHHCGISLNIHWNEGKQRKRHIYNW